MEQLKAAKVCLRGKVGSFFLSHCCPSKGCAASLLSCLGTLASLGMVTQGLNIDSVHPSATPYGAVVHAADGVDSAACNDSLNVAEQQGRQVVQLACRFLDSPALEELIKKVNAADFFNKARKGKKSCHKR